MKVLSPEILSAFLPNRPAQSHKGMFGRVLVVAGSKQMAGAGLLCAKSVLKAGAGLAVWALPESIQPHAACRVPEVITLPIAQTEQGTFSAAAVPALLEAVEKFHIDLLIIGPGLGAADGVLPLLKNCTLPAVIDADALNQLARQNALGELFPRTAPCIFTPHPGEMNRLLGEEISPEDSGHAEAAQALALQTGGVCVLKGFHTVVADGHNAWQNPTGGPALAKAGTGDVLCGMIGGLWAQLGKSGGFTEKTALHAAACGVYLHGLCGDLAAKELTDTCVLAGELLNYLPAAFKQLKSKGSL